MSLLGNFFCIPSKAFLAASAAMAATAATASAATASARRERRRKKSVSPFVKVNGKQILVLLSSSVERFSVSRIRDFYFMHFDIFDRPNMTGAAL